MYAYSEQGVTLENQLDNQTPAKKRIRERMLEIHRNSIDKITTLIISAFGLVAALAWNNAIQKLFTVIFGSQSNLSAELAYALFVTIIAVIVTMYLTRESQK